MSKILPLSYTFFKFFHSCLFHATFDLHFTSQILKTTAQLVVMAVDVRRGKNRSLETLLDIDKAVATKPLPPPQLQKSLSTGRGLEFNNLSYSVLKKYKKDGVWIKREAYLLNDISGQAMRGEVMAILGPSGAGKSTFLDALAGRMAKGSLEGSVRIDGKPVTASYMKMVSSYVMQDDQLFPMLTVFETFMFAAEVRLPSSISRDEKKNRVFELIDQLGLQVYIPLSLKILHQKNEKTSQVTQFIVI